MIEGYLTNEKGPNRFAHFFGRVLVPHYEEGKDYFDVQYEHPVVQHYIEVMRRRYPNMGNAHKLSRKKYYLVTGKCYKKLLMRASTSAGEAHLEVINDLLMAMSRREDINNRVGSDIGRTIAAAAPTEDSFLTLLDPNGEQIRVICRASDGYINATALCKASGDKRKDMSHWSENKKGKEFLEELSRSTGIPGDALTIAITTGPNEGRGTWVHPRVAINIAQWISPLFDVQVSGWIQELLVRGEVRLGHETSEVELMRQQIEQMQLQLAEKDSQPQRVREEERLRAEAEAKTRWQRKQEVLLRVHDKSSRAGFIYMMRTPNREGISKIGLTDCVERRLSEFRTSEPAMYCHRKWRVPDMEVTERALHAIFDDIRTSKHTEWFYDYPGFEEEIESHIHPIASVPRADVVARVRAALEALATLPSIEDEVVRSQRARRNRRSDSPSTSCTDDSGSEAEAPSTPATVPTSTPSTSSKHPWHPSLTRELEREAARAKEQRGIVRYKMGEKAAIMKEIWESRQSVTVNLTVNMQQQRQ